MKKFNKSQVTYSKTQSGLQRIVIILLFTWFMGGFLFERNLGLNLAGGETSYLKIYRAVFQFTLLSSTILFAIKYLVAGKLFIPKVPALYSLFFLGVGIIAFFKGLLDYPENIKFIFGDAFKFFSLPLLVILSCSAIKQVSTLYKLLIISIYVIALYIIKVSAFYILGILATHTLPTNIYMIPFFAVLWHALQPYGKQYKSYRILGTVYIIGVIIIGYYSQSLTFWLELLILFGLYIYLQTNKTNRIFLFGFVFSSIAFILANGLIEYNDLNESNYMLNKFSKLQLGNNFFEYSVLLGGDRLFYIISVLSQPRSLFEWLFGVGLGSYLELSNLEYLNIDLSDKWKESRHYIESGFAEVIYRTGLFGFFTFFILFYKTFTRSIKKKANFNTIHDKRLFALIGSYLIYFLVFSFYNNGFPNEGLSSPFLISIIFAYVWLPSQELTNHNTHEN